jgi:hypothetical protein
MKTSMERKSTDLANYSGISASRSRFCGRVIVKRRSRIFGTKLIIESYSKRYSVDGRKRGSTRMGCQAVTRATDD